MTIDVLSPSDGRHLGSVPIHTADDVEAAIRLAREAQSGWGELAPPARARRLKRLRHTLGDRSEEIADLLQAETGKPRVEALTEIVVIADVMRFYARVAQRVLGARRVGTSWLVGKSASVRREPYGVVGAITPWNYPFVLTMDAVVAALFAGNAIVLKPSEYTPLTALKLVELAREAGLPEGLVSVVTGDGTTGAALAHSSVDKLFFTGSTATGKKVLAAAAETLTPVGLELGGKDPALVLGDADLERTARGIVYGAFFNAGQTCISTERVFAVSSIYDALVDRITELTNELTAGSEGEYDVGPMVTPFQVAIVEAHVEDARERGARVTVGGKRAGEGSQVFLPTVIADVDPSMKVMRDETFGPLLPVMRVEDEEEAIRMANATSYGLFASVWTKDLARGRAVAARIRAGGVSINETLVHYAVPGLPMGGVGESGFGRRRGVEGLEEMSVTRSMLVHRWGFRSEIWWFPYRPEVRGVVYALLHFMTGRGLMRFPRALRALVRGRRH